MVIATGSSQAQQQAGSTGIFSLEAIIQTHGLAPVKLNLWEKFQLKRGSLPFNGPHLSRSFFIALATQDLATQYIVATQYGASRLADLLVQPGKGYSAVALQLEKPSEVGLDNLTLNTDNVFAAATHNMWVQLGTPVRVMYESPAQLERDRVYFSSALIIPMDREVVLTVTGIKPVPEQEVLNNPKRETVHSPDLVRLGDGRTFFDVREVKITSEGAVRLVPIPGPPRSHTLGMPVSNLAAHSIYATKVEGG